MSESKKLDYIFRKKRKVFYITIGCVILLMVVCVLMLNHLNIINITGATTFNKCTFPYTKSKCQKRKNDTVKKAQELLKKLKFYDDDSDGYYGPKTKKAVEKFQEKYNLEADGNMGYRTLKKLAEKTNTRYFTIKYSLNGGKGELTNTMKINKEPKQIIFYGVKQEISTTKLTKKDSTHVGWTAKTVWNRTEYEYGCTTNDCSDSSRTLTWYSTTTKGNTKDNGLKKYYYDIGTKVSATGFKGTMQEVIFTAQYCKTGYTYDKKKSSCVFKNAKPKTSTVKTTTKKSTTTTTKKASSSSNVFLGKKYSLTNSQLKGIARLCQQEQGSAKGAAAEASLMVNRFELYGNKKYGTSATGLYNYIKNSGWWYKASTYMGKANPNSEVLAAVKDVLINGNRTLPLYVDEHDCMGCGDITKLKNGSTIITNKSSIKNRSNYIKNKTVIYNRYGAVYTFYSFPTSTSDPFGYTTTAKNKVDK